MLKVASTQNLFTKHEQRVFQLLLHGFLNKQIAFKLQITEKTVEKHLTNIYGKLGTSSRVEAVLWGITQSGGTPT
jgi:DNA-binding NarL/FixJ family response regulator